MQVYGFNHPLKKQLEDAIGLQQDMERAQSCLQLLIGPPPMLGGAGLFVTALYTQALVSYVRCFAKDGVQNSFRRTESSKRSGCVTDDAKPDANGTLRAAWRGRFPPARGGFPSCAGLTHQSPAHHPQIAQGKQRV